MMNLIENPVRSRPHMIAAAVRKILTTGLLVTMLSACGGGDGSGAVPAGTGSNTDPATGTGGTGNTGGTGGGTGGSGGTGGTGGGASGSAANPVVYLADQDTYQIDELYMTIPGSPGNTVKLNPALVQGGWVDDFRIMPTGDAVVYTADQYILGRYELFVVNMANPGTSTRLSAALTPNRDVVDFAISPDGTKVAYRADADADNIYELYVVNVANPGQAVKVNGSLPPSGFVRGEYEFSPDSSKLLYRADESVASVLELYVVDVATPGQSEKVNPSLVSGGNVYGDFHFTADGARIVYVADQITDGQLELFVATTNAPGASTRLNGTLIPEGDVCHFELAPDSQRVAYCADQEADGRIELFTVAFEAPTESVKLNPPLAAGGSVSSAYDFSADSSYVVYLAKQDSADKQELYRVALASPGSSTRLNAPLVTGGNVSMFTLREDNSHIGYLATQDSASVGEIHEVDMSAPGVSTKISAPMQAGGAYWFEYTEGSTHMVYLAEQDRDASELYDVQIAQPGVSTKLSATLTTGGEVWEYEVIP